MQTEIGGKELRAVIDTYGGKVVRLYARAAENTYGAKRTATGRTGRGCFSPPAAECTKNV